MGERGCGLVVGLLVKYGWAACGHCAHLGSASYCRTTVPCTPLGKVRPEQGLQATCAAAWQHSQRHHGALHPYSCSFLCSPVPSLPQAWSSSSATPCACTQRHSNHNNPSLASTPNRNPHAPCPTPACTYYTGVEFFQRYPALHGFLLQELQEAAAELQQQPTAAAAAAGDAVASPPPPPRPQQPHPGLYPVLIILSRLRASHVREEPAAAAVVDAAGPGGDGGGDAGGDAAAPAAAAATTFMGALSPVAFTPLVRQCATAAPLTVRRLAARALSPLVAAADVPPLLQQLLAAIPAEPPGTARLRAAADAAAAGGGAATTTSSPLPPPIRFGGSANALHGALLQAAALLEGNVDPPPPEPSSAAAAGSADVLPAALDHLTRGSWLADPRVGVSALGCGLLAAAAAALDLVPPGRCMELRGPVGRLAAACKEAVAFAPPGSAKGGGGGGGGSPAVFAADFPDPMRCQLLKQAAQLWLGPVLQCQAFR